MKKEEIESNEDLNVGKAPFAAAFAFGLASWAVVTAEYFYPFFQSQGLTTALKPILLFQTFRYIGLAFLVPGVVAHDVPPRVANPGAYGDMIACILAWIAYIAVSTGDSIGARVVVWIFNVVGFIDLLYVIFNGQVLHPMPPGKLGALFFVVVGIVPLILISHITIFILLTTNHNV